MNYLMSEMHSYLWGEGGRAEIPLCVYVCVYVAVYVCVCVWVCTQI